MPSEYLWTEQLKTNKMKQTISILGVSLLLFIFPACVTDDDDCKIGNTVIACENATIYEAFVSKENAINRTFDKFAKKLTVKENLSLRTDIVEYYNKNSDILESVYMKVKDSIFGAREPKMIFEMRNEEINYFQKEITDAEKAKAFSKTLSIRQYEVDTTLYEGGDKSAHLVLEIHNTSDSTISGIAINKVYEKEGKLTYPDMPTHYIFDHDMISPTPTDKAVLRPNDTLTLTFKTSKTKIAKPEITSFIFAK